MTTAIIILALLVLLAWGVRGAVRWYNLDKVEGERAKKVSARQQGWTDRLKERLRHRRERWGRRRGRRRR